MALTDPYPADLDLTQAFRHVFRATVWPANLPPFELEVTGAPVLEYSRSWSPYVRANFEAAKPLDAAKLAALDPRAKTYVHLDMGYQRPAGPVVPNVAMLRLDQADINTRGSLDIALLGMESTAQEATWIREYDPLLPRTGVVEALGFLIRQATPGFQRTVISSLPNGYRADLLATDRDDSGDLLPVFQEGTDIWSAIDSLSAQAGLKVWEDGLKAWHIATRRQISSTAALVLSDGPGGLLTDGSYRRSRRGWYNSVILTFPDAPRKHPDYVLRGLARAGGRYAPELVGEVCYRASRPGHATADSAWRAARSLLETFLARGNTYSMEAVAAYWLRPGMIVEARIQGASSRQLVESVKFHPWDGLMSIETTPDEIEE